MFLTERRNLNKYPLFESKFFTSYAEETGEITSLREEITDYSPKFIIGNKEESFETLGIKEFIQNNYKKLSNEISTDEYLVYERI